MTSDLRFGGTGWPLEVVRRPRMRGMRLAVDQRARTVRLSLPPRAPLGRALEWAAGKRPWVEAVIAGAPDAVPIVPGMTIMVAGADLRLDWSPDYPRAARFGDEILGIGGLRAGLANRVLRALKANAATLLDTETRDLARRHGITVGRVGIGDPRSRWGSCSATGDIRYSWRLILAPREVVRATVAHEVAHRVHMNHGPAFHAMVAEMFGRDPAPERRWLRANGAALHGFGRDG